MSKPGKLQTILTLMRHQKLSERRSPVWNQSKAAKVLMYIGIVLTVLYLIFIAVMLSLIANSSGAMTPIGIIFGLTPFMMVLDFGTRLLAQQTPSQLIKPYILLPISKYTCIDSFILSSLSGFGNLTWFGLFIPYTLMSVLFSRGVWISLAFLLALYLLILIWNQWYMLARGLANRRYYWWVLPGLFFALVFSPWYIGKNASVVKLCDTYAWAGTQLEKYPLLVLTALAAVLCGLIALNRRLQYRFVYAELAKVERTHIRHVTQMNSLSRFGETGEYIKLEIKSLMRNKNCRKAFLSGLVFVLIFSLLITFTDVYDNDFMTVYLVLYNFSIFGVMLLSKIMNFEGNYIDCLMVRKENILTLFKAKYYFYGSMLLLPLVLMIPMVIKGKVTALMLLSVMLFTAGVIYMLVFMLVIYNKQTLPLNTKFIGQGRTDTNYLQIVISLSIYVLPLALIFVLKAFCSETTTYIVIGVIGLLFVLARNYWLRWVYGLFMKRRYVNMESLRATR